MNNQQFVDLIDDQFFVLGKISASKGREYASDDTDRLANFKRLAKELNLEPEQVLWVYFAKHKDSIATFIKDLNDPTPRVLSEPIEGRIDDAILYLILLKGLIKDRYGTHRVHVGGPVCDPSDDFDEAERTAGSGLSTGGAQCAGPVDCGPGAFNVGGGQVVPAGDPPDQHPV